ncbi:MAG: hypothetical protein ABSH08_19245, partial [Tepidisphaeraceae bacterium]
CVTAKTRRTRSYAKKKTRVYFSFAQLRALRAFAVKFFGLRAELALCVFAVKLFSVKLFGLRAQPALRAFAVKFFGLRPEFAPCSFAVNHPGYLRMAVSL